jgi:hypothetical protein
LWIEFEKRIVDIILEKDYVDNIRKDLWIEFEKRIVG